MMSAARGLLAVLVGDRRAPGYFDFSQRGLFGSFIAFFAASLINALSPMLMGIELPPGALGRGLVMVLALFAVQIAFSALVLRQLGRLDGLVPYLVADNWATFFITLISTVMAFAGISGELSIILLGILVIIVEINVARLIVTLSALQIAMFLIAQLVGVTIMLMVLGSIFPGLMPDISAAAELAANAPQ